jgi:hypothetical protein
MGVVTFIVIYLQEARTVLSNAKEVNVCHQCNGHSNDMTRCDEKNEDGYHAEVIELKQEINTLKQENVKLSEDLNQKIAKLRETEDAQSLLLYHIHKMRNEKLKLSESLEGCFEAVHILKSVLSSLKKENDELRHKSATTSRSVEGKYEESEKQSSEISRLKKENVASSGEIANLPKTSEDTVMEFTELQQREKPPSTCTAPDMKIALRQNRRQNCLQRKVARQRRILNGAQERELKMKNDIELCKEISL